MIWSSRDITSVPAAVYEKQPARTNVASSRPSDLASRAANRHTLSAVRRPTDPAKHEPARQRSVIILAGRCVDETGQPLSGCLVRLHHHLPELQAYPAGVAAELRRWVTPTQTTSADGRFALSFPSTTACHPYHVSIAKRNRVTVLITWPWPQRHDCGDITLRQGCILSGRTGGSGPQLAKRARERSWHVMRRMIPPPIPFPDPPAKWPAHRPTCS